MLGQFIALGRAVIINRRTWRNGKLSIQLLAKASSEKLTGRADRVNAGEAQFFHQLILVNAVIAFHSSFGFRRVSRDDLNPQLLAGPAKMGPDFFTAVGRSGVCLFINYMDVFLICIELCGIP